jgi:Rod binding domain-containing protein
MFQSMKKTVGEGGIFGESFQRNMYESLYIEKMAVKIAEERDLGLGDSLYRQLTARMGDGDGEGEAESTEESGKDALAEDA